MPKGMRSRARPRSVAPADGGFLWGSQWIGTVIHSHIAPFSGDPEARLVKALPECLPTARRDALILLGQYAAHLAFLRFARIGNTRIDPLEWGVIKERGRDPRLVRRMSPDVSKSDEMLPVTLLEQFSEMVGAPRLGVLRQSWVRPEAVYAEVLARVGEVAGDTTSLRRAAWGVVRAPGPDILHELLTRKGITVLADEDAIASARASGGSFMVLGENASPLEPFSGVQELISGEERPDEKNGVVERVLEVAGGDFPVLAVTNWRAFDPQSRRVVRLLIDAGDPLSWILPNELESIVPSHRHALSGEPTRRYLLSTSVAAEHDLLGSLEARTAFEFERWCIEFCSSPEFDVYVEEGKVPRRVASRGVDLIEEPLKSFVSALAMLGTRFPASAAEAMLTSLGFPGKVDEVASAGIVARAGENELEFVDASTRGELLDTIPLTLRQSLATIAADLPGVSSDPLRRLSLLIEADRFDEAEACALDLRAETHDATRVTSFLPRNSMAVLRSCPHVAALRCKALIDLGRYVDAARESSEIDGSCGRFIRALIKRRLGDYGAALDELGTVEGDACSFEEHLLSGELHRLKGHHDAASEAFSRARAGARDARDRGRLAYEQALLAFDRGMQGSEDELPDNPYYESRYLFYEAAGDGDLTRAVGYATQALDRAATIPEKVDAELDLVFALFLSGDWNAARHEARAALVILEETQGDRAAAGILFTLAFLCADDGQWTQAEQKIARLKLFYDECEDERRARELDLLRAHLALSRLETGEAERLAEALLKETLSSEMREAAALILDEVGWMRGDLVSPRSSGQSQCVELTRRHLLFVARTSHVTQHEILKPFHAGLCRWEAAWRREESLDPPVPANRTEQLLLLRSMIALHARRPTAQLRSRIEDLATRFGLGNALRSSESGTPNRELGILRLAATEPFPFEADSLGVDWRLISRTRTDRWTQSGSKTPLSEEEAERILVDPPRDWVRCGLRTMMWIDGLDTWCEESRAALSAIVETRMENVNLRRLVQPETLPGVMASAKGIIGESAAICETLGRIEPASRRDVAVCIQGESGTGKELIARAIHDRSSRRGRPFTAINCAALPENLIESELFGCVRGAFTGADRDRKGLIEATDEGTLFLDEIAEMALSAQAKLLRFLQEREFRRVGETINRSADVRIIAATNRRLEDAVDSGEFRDDLYYRIRGIEITVPPLRDRGADVLLLARHFLRVELELHRAGPASLSEDVEDMLLSHSWPGNVRELQQTIRAAHAIAGDARLVMAEHLPERMQKNVRKKVPRGSLNEEVSRFRRGLIERALEAASGNQSRAASQLGVTRQALAYQIKELGILVEKRR